MLTNQQLEINLRKIFVLIVGASLFTPLLIIKNVLRPYILSKTFPFQILVLLLLGIWAVLLVLDFKKYRPSRNLLVISLSIFLFVVFLSMIFSTNFYRSFWGNAERTEGFINLLHFYLFALAIFSVLKDKPEILKKLILWTLTVSLLAAFYPLLQKAKILFSPAGEGFGRPGGSFGNPTFLSGYLLVHLFLGLWYLFDNLSQKKKIFSAINIFLLFILIVDFAVFVWVQTRGSFIGLFLGIFIALIASLFVFPKKYKIIVGVALLAIALSAGLFWAFRSEIKNSIFAKKIPIINRLANVSFNDSSARARWVTWQWSLEWFKKRPILGVGQDMFYMVFDDNYSANNQSLMSERFDRSHNKYIDVLVMNGAIGFLAYLFLLGTIFYIIAKKIKEATNFEAKVAWLVIVALFVAYMGHNFFVFDTPANSLIFYFLLSWLLVFSFRPTASPNPSIKKEVGFNPSKLFVVSLFLILVLGTVFYFVDYKPYQAARLVFEAAAATPTDIPKVFDYYKQTIAKETFINTETRKMWADYFMKVLLYSRFQKPLLDNASSKSYSEELIAELEKGYQHEPMIDFYVYSANIYAQLTWVSGFGESDKAYFGEREKWWFSEIARKWPQRTDFYIIYAEDQVFRENYDYAEKLADEILTRTPNYGRAQWLRAMIMLVKNENVESAFQYISAAIDSGHHWDIKRRTDILFAVASKLKKESYPLLIKLLDYQYESEKSGVDLSQVETNIDMSLRVEKTKSLLDLLIHFSLVSSSPDYHRLIYYLEESLNYRSDNAEYWVKLAAVYAKLHNKEKAIFAANKAAEINPQAYATDARTFIQIVENEQWDRLP